MSTRCQIGIYDKTYNLLSNNLANPKVLLYKHCDGYPSAMVPLLTDFCREFARGWGIYDYEFCGAHLMYYMLDRYVQTYGKGNSFFSAGYGVCHPTEFHDDIEYYYGIFPCNTLVVFRPNFEEIEKISF